VVTGRRRTLAAALAACAAAAAGPAAAAAAPAQVRDYDLGRVELAAPGPFGPLPVRLWGAIGAPVAPGPHPLVLVLHGRHGDNCPVGPGDSEVWPCFRRERRNDLGLRHVVRALAERGLVALAPDLNGAFTGGWGEPDDRDRWPLILNRVLRELALEASTGGGRFGIDLRGRLDLRHIGLLGHSLSGRHAVRAARRRARNRGPEEVALGRGPVRALFLLAPVPGGGELPDVPAVVAVGTCDGDTGTSGRAYFTRARAARGRHSVTVLAELRRANHNFFNRALARRDDAPIDRARCRPDRRPSAHAQRRWLARAAADFFAAALRSAPRPDWLRLGASPPPLLHGLAVRVRRTR
jgi:dienelactone hydrolase